MPDRRSHVILLLGAPESGIASLAKAIHAAGGRLAVDAARDDDRFATSPGLDAVAAQIDETLGLAEDVSGPLIVANTSLRRSRRKIGDHLEALSARAVAAIIRALPDGGTKPVVLAASRMGRFPGFWLAAFDRAGHPACPVLPYRNPVAVAQQARRTSGRSMRQSVFLWHHSMLDTLSAAPDRIVVLAGPDIDLSPLGLTGPARATISQTPKDAADLSKASIVSEQTRALDELLRLWSSLDRAERSKRLGSLRNRFDDAVTLLGTARIVSVGEREAAPATSTDAPAIVAARTERSPLLFHYHIFKNAGTSVDRMLKANFADGWMEKEFEGGTPTDRRQAAQNFLAQNPALKAFSSHTASLPVPDLPERAIFPIIFLRHPLLRVQSAYRFERRQDAQTRGAILAKSTDFAGYVRAFLDDPRSRHVRNFQTFRFAIGTPGPVARELARALETISRLPFVGLVEDYGRSIDRLAERVRPLFPEFNGIALHENATGEASNRTIDESLIALREALGTELFDRLIEANADDLAIFDDVRTSYDPYGRL